MTAPAEHRTVWAGRDPRRRWAVLAWVGCAVLVLSYVVLVLTPAGQALENAALRGADQADAASVAQADDALDAITVTSLAVGIAVIGVLGLLRRSAALAVAAVGTVVAGQVLAQVLKRVVLPRPGLVEASPAYTGNSFPSGHTTIALTVLAAVLLLTSYRWRGLVVFVVAGWATSIGAYTLTAKWHRFSDTLGAAGIALLVASLAALWLHRRGLVRPVAGPPRRLRVVLVVVPLAATALLGAALGGFLLVATPDLLSGDEVTDDNAYLALQVLAGAGSIATALALWWGWHRLEVVPPAERR